MKEYDVFVPIRYNDGADIELQKFKDLQKRLLEEFDGVTFFSQPNEGLWRMGDVVYHDEIVIYRVLCAKQRKARRFLSRLKEELKASFQQEEILIIERDVETL